MKDDSWFRGLRPVTLDVECNGLSHHIVWQRGKIVVADHDVESELALTALGADPVPCMEFLFAWQDAMREPGMLRRLMGAPWLSGRKSWTISISVPAVPPGALVAHQFRARILEMQRRNALQELDGPMRKRLIASILAGLGRGGAWMSSVEWWSDDLIEENASPPLVRSVHHWLAPGSAARVTVFPTIEVAGWGEEPVLLGQTSSSSLIEVAARLPASWLLDVWCRELEVVDGAFVLKVIDCDEDGNWFDVLATRWDRDPPSYYPVSARASIRVTDEGPRLWWTEAA